MEYRGLYDSDKSRLSPACKLNGDTTEYDIRLCKIMEQLRGDTRLTNLVEILINNIPK